MTTPSHRSATVQTLGVLYLFSICGVNILYGILFWDTLAPATDYNPLTDVARRGPYYMYSRPLLHRKFGALSRFVVAYMGSGCR
jgi:hypothetical protein